MDIKHILEKLSEIDTKHTLLESAPAAKVLVESTVAEPKRTSIYDVLVSELMAEADYTLPKGKFPNAITQGNAPGAGIANPPPNLNVAAPTALTPTPNITAPANAPAAAPAANAKPGFADRVKAGFQQQAEKNAQYNKEMAAAGSPEAKAEWAQKLTPSQLKWLGGADASDPAIRARMPKPLPGETTPAATTAANAQAQQADMDASSQGATPASDLAKANAQDQQADMDASSQPVATTSPVAPQTPPQAVITTPAAADPAAPAVTANPTANPAVTPAKTPYKGSAGSQEIQKLNPAIKDVNKIYPGQALKMPDGSTYTVKPGDTLDKIAKGVKPAEATKMPPAKQQDQIDKAPQAAPTPAATPPAAKPAPAPAAGQKEAPAPFRKELDLDRIKQLSGAPAKPGKLDLSVNNPAMNPASPGKTQSGTTVSNWNESMYPEDDAILTRIKSIKF